MSNLELLEGQSLSVAVMLSVDNYNYNPDPKAISATTILQPLRQLQLKKLKGCDNRVISIQDIVASRTGSAIHTMLEESWLNPESLKKCFSKLGFKNAKALVNPTKNQLKKLKQSKDKDTVVVWVENSASKKVFTYTLTGTFDICINGTLEDLKNTGSFKVKKAMQEIERFNNQIDVIPVTKLSLVEYYNIIEGIKEDCPTIFDYAMQGSIYKYLNPDKITDDIMYIQFIIKDWSKGYATKDANYPPTNPFQLTIPLFNYTEVESWVFHKLTLLDKADMNSLATCTANELWMDKPTWKVYAKETSKRCYSGGTFHTRHEADKFLMKKPSGSVIKKMPNVPRRCPYCPVRNKCTQADKLGVPKNKVVEENK